MGCLCSSPLPQPDEFLRPQAVSSPGGGLAADIPLDRRYNLLMGTWKKPGFAMLKDVPVQNIDVCDFKTGEKVCSVVTKASGVQHLQDLTVLRTGSGNVVGCMRSNQNRLAMGIESVSYTIYGSRPLTQNQAAVFAVEGVNMFAWATHQRKAAISMTFKSTVSFTGGKDDFSVEFKFGRYPSEFTMTGGSGGAVLGYVNSDQKRNLVVAKGMDPLLAVCIPLSATMMLDEYEQNN